MLNIDTTGKKTSFVHSNNCQLVSHGAAAQLDSSWPGSDTWCSHRATFIPIARSILFRAIYLGKKITRKIVSASSEMKIYWIDSVFLLLPLFCVIFYFKWVLWEAAAAAAARGELLDPQWSP